MEEVRVVETTVLREHAVWQRHVVAPRDARDQLGRGGALEVHVEFGLGKHRAALSHIWSIVLSR